MNETPEDFLSNMEKDLKTKNSPTSGEHHNLSISNKEEYIKTMMEKFIQEHGEDVKGRESPSTTLEAAKRYATMEYAITVALVEGMKDGLNPVIGVEAILPSLLTTLELVKQHTPSSSGDCMTTIIENCATALGFSTNCVEHKLDGNDDSQKDGGDDETEFKKWCDEHMH